MDVIQWGTVPDWFAAVGTVGAFAGTVWVISRDGRTRKREQKEAEWDQANKFTISASSTGGPPGPNGDPTNLIGVQLSNGGRRSIYNVNVMLIVNHDLRGVEEVNDIPPDRMQPVNFPWINEAFGPTGFNANVVVTFTDVEGRRWMKDISGHLTKPMPTQPTSRLGRWRFKRRVKKLGIGVTQLPKPDD